MDDVCEFVTAYKEMKDLMILTKIIYFGCVNMHVQQTLRNIEQVQIRESRSYSTVFGKNLVII